MFRLLRLTITLLCLLALACGNDSPQGPEVSSAFTPEKFVGKWKATVPQLYVFPVIWLEDYSGVLLVDSLSYRFDLAFSADTLDLFYSETGNWHWDSANDKLLFFDYNQFTLQVVKRTYTQGFTRTERAVSSDSNGGAWYCHYGLDQDKITLFDTNGPGAGGFNTIILNYL